MSGFAHRQQSGYTLIELMIVVMVLGILAAIGYASYTSYVKKAARADAKAALTTWAQALERCYSQYYYYYNASPSSTQPDCPAPPNSGASVTSPNGYYSITAARTQNSYSLLATPISGKPSAADTACTTLALDNNGVKTASGSAPATCW